jgi:hypothetical protein
VGQAVGEIGQRAKPNGYWPREWTQICGASSARLTESSHLWYEEFKSFLTDLGYVNHPADQGMFIKTTSDGYKLTNAYYG